MYAHVRYLAWAHTRSDKKSSITRQQLFGALLHPPEVELFWYIDWLFEVGPVTYQDGTATKISWQEIEAWIRVTGKKATNFEATLIRKASEWYAAGIREFDGEHVDAPTHKTT